MIGGGKLVALAAVGLLTVAGIAALHSQRGGIDRSTKPEEMFRFQAERDIGSLDAIDVYMQNDSGRFINGLSGQVQMVQRGIPLDTQSFYIKNVPAHGVGSDTVYFKYGSVVKKPSLVLREIDICELEGKYYRGCGAASRGSNAGGVPVSVEVHTSG